MRNLAPPRGLIAGSTLATAPLLIVFVLLQRHFIAGILAGSLKA
jgi:lactose/L-arabinose transport system permease protein